MSNIKIHEIATPAHMGITLGIVKKSKAPVVRYEVRMDDERVALVNTIQDAFEAKMSWDHGMGKWLSTPCED